MEFSRFCLRALFFNGHWRHRVVYEDDFIVDMIAAYFSMPLKFEFL